MTRGSTFDRDKDGDRIDAQLARVRALMLDSRWRTLAEIGAECGAPEASVSARLRDLRKHGLVVDRERVPDGNGLHRYRVRIPAQPRGQMTLFPVKGGA